MLGENMKFVVVKAYIYNRKTNKLLAIKRALNDVRGGIWENPGGGLTRNEEPLDGIKREVMEETGLLIKNPIFLYDDQIKNTNIVFKNYIAYTETEKIMLSNEHTDYKWLDVDDYLGLIDKTIKDNFNKHMVIYNLK